MNVKLDTKEKFKILTPQLEEISATMTEELENLLTEHSQSDIPHLILDLKEVESIDPTVAERIADVQRSFYENSLSFVICDMQPAVIAAFKSRDLLDSLNYTPTQSEAWDIVQMEEIERELMNGLD